MRGKKFRELSGMDKFFKVVGSVLFVCAIICFACAMFNPIVPDVVIVVFGTICMVLLVVFSFLFFGKYYKRFDW